MGYYKYLKRNLAFRIPHGKTVIDIGPGHAPLIRADVLCDRYPLETKQRPIPAIYIPKGRFVVGDIQDLPFLDQSFDFAYCSAVLEHLKEPDRACREITRIAKAGLIRVPSSLWETMGGSEAHLWLVHLENNTLVFRRKTLEDTRLNSLIPEKIRNSKAYEKLFDTFYADFFIDYHWKGHIPFEIKGLDLPGLYEFSESEDASFMGDKELYHHMMMKKGPMRFLKTKIFAALRHLLGGKDILLETVLACPVCKKGLKPQNSQKTYCPACNLYYPVIGEVPILLKEAAIPASER